MDPDFAFGQMPTARYVATVCLAPNTALPCMAVIMDGGVFVMASPAASIEEACRCLREHLASLEAHEDDVEWRVSRAPWPASYWLDDDYKGRET